MKEILVQVRTIWKEMRPLPRVVVLAILLGVGVLLFYATLPSREGRYLPLSLPQAEPARVRHYLEENHIPFKEHPERGILLPEERVDSIRTQLTASGYTKQEPGKGFELFDSSTWIKGDKELQVLEMRALKGQIEQDLAHFDAIKSASVILDMAPTKTLSPSPKTKASVIVKLMPHASLSPSQLMAITYHVTGAVRGLEPHMIAISDTTGKLYKTIDPEGKKEEEATSALLFEERLSEKIEMLLLPLLGPEHFVLSLHAALDKGASSPHTLALVLLIDHAYEALLPSIEAQLHTLLSAYPIPCQATVHAVPFDKEGKGGVEEEPPSRYGRWVVSLLGLLLFCVVLYPLFHRYRKKRGEEELYQVMTRVDLSRLASSMQGEDPETLALLLSYLEPARAEAMLSAFPKEKQEAILFYLNQLEQEI